MEGDLLRHLVDSWSEHKEQRLGVVALSTPVLPHKHRTHVEVAGIGRGGRRIARAVLIPASRVGLVAAPVASVPPATTVLLSTVATQKSIVVAVGCREPHPVVPLEGVSCLGTARVPTHLQTVVLVLACHAEFLPLSPGLAVTPVCDVDAQFVVLALGHGVEGFQADPVLAGRVPEARLVVVPVLVEVLLSLLLQPRQDEGPAATVGRLVTPHLERLQAPRLDEVGPAGPVSALHDLCAVHGQGGVGGAGGVHHQLGDLVVGVFGVAALFAVLLGVVSALLGVARDRGFGGARLLLFGVVLVVSFDVVVALLGVVVLAVVVAVAVLALVGAVVGVGEVVVMGVVVVVGVVVGAADVDAVEAHGVQDALVVALERLEAVLDLVVVRAAVERLRHLPDLLLDVDVVLAHVPDGGADLRHGVGQAPVLLARLLHGRRDLPHLAQEPTHLLQDFVSGGRAMGGVGSRRRRGHALVLVLGRGGRRAEGRCGRGRGPHSGGRPAGAQQGCQQEGGVREREQSS